MEHVNGWCFRGIYKGGLWEDDLHVSAHLMFSVVMVTIIRRSLHTITIRSRTSQMYVSKYYCGSNL